jgi:hypothetical protein
VIVALDGHRAGIQRAVSAAATTVVVARVGGQDALVGLTVRDGVSCSSVRRHGRSPEHRFRFAMVRRWAWWNCDPGGSPRPPSRGRAATNIASQTRACTTDGYAAPQPTLPKEGSQPSAPPPSRSAGSGRERAPHAPGAGVPAPRHGSVAGATGVGPGAAHSAGRGGRHRPAHGKDAVPTQRPGSSCAPGLEPRSGPASRRIRGRLCGGAATISRTAPGEWGKSPGAAPFSRGRTGRGAAAAGAHIGGVVAPLSYEQATLRLRRVMTRRVLPLLVR